MKSRAPQQGAALLLMLLSLLLIASYAWYQAGRAGGQAGHRELNERLQRAKEALIARAVTDANRPGSLPCPDLITDDNGLNNHPNDGKSDNLTRNDCPSYLGWLPWVTLDLPELVDDSGSRLWYVLARSLRDDDLAQPINSDTATPLSLDGRGDIAALIIAPGAALSGQSRPSSHPADYLEGENANGDYLFASGPASEQLNDVVLALTRQELMSAVEKRVAAEVRACLEQHATASANVGHAYPWPAPLASSNENGRSGSYFGRIPLRQAGAGPQAEVAASSANLQAAGLRLRDESDPSRQMTALQALNDNLAYAKILYDRIYATSKELALLAQSNTSSLADLGSTLTSANSNGRISVSERKTIQTDGDSKQSGLALLLTTLGNTGIDVFPDELAARNLLLQNAIDLNTPLPTSTALGPLLEAGNALLNLLGNSHTPNVDIDSGLGNSLALGLNTLTALQNSIAAPRDSLLLDVAVDSARRLKSANDQLQDTIAGNRIGLPPGEINAQAERLSAQLASFKQAPDGPGRVDLASLLGESHTLVSRISTLSSTLLPLRSASLNALNSAAAATGSHDWSLVIGSTQNAIDQINVLGQAMLAHGDNLSRASLQEDSRRFDSQLDTFNNILTRTQAELLPYAENLRLAAVDLQFWAEIINRQASNIATLARKSPAAGKTQSNAASAYSLAEQALNSINKSTGSLKKLQDYLDDPGKSSKRTAANTAISDTLTQFDKLLPSLANLAQNLHGNEADAFPVLWHGSRCAFLQPGTDNTSWWQANQWTSTTFIQISSRLRGSTGKLRVNGAGAHHSIVISAGPPLGTQHRPSPLLGNYLEGVNADPSRAGDASRPAANFTSAPSRTDFNDRLAY